MTTNGVTMGGGTAEVELYKPLIQETAVTSRIEAAIDDIHDQKDGALKKEATASRVVTHKNNIIQVYVMADAEIATDQTPYDGASDDVVQAAWSA